MEEYCIYLRKSRTDEESENKGEGETLQRHKKTLLELAKRQRLTITKIYEEVVTGETIAARPQMQKLLMEVEQGLWAGVLVMEVERLARGDTIDQGIVSQAFKYSNTRIITPIKSYDPNNEFDEEYFEFGLFMSRREYKVINRRLQRGRIASVMEGKYVGNKTPYGYQRVKLQGVKGYTLQIVPDEAEIIRMIFNLYTEGEIQEDGTKQSIGVTLITKKLNRMMVSPKNGTIWVSASVRDILINPVYIGKVRWNWRPAKKKMVNGKVSISRPRTSADEIILVDGLHESIVSEEIFKMAQDIMKNNKQRPIGERNKVMNPLGGLVICGKCGRRMVRRPYKDGKYPDTLMCAVPECDNVSSALHYVEKRILSALGSWIREYELQWNFEENADRFDAVSANQKTMLKLKASLETLETQKSKAYDLLEQGVYTADIFIERAKDIGERLQKIEAEYKVIENEIELAEKRKKGRISIIPKAKTLLATYDNLPTAKAKNDLLKEVLEKVVYIKVNNGRWHYAPDDFEIAIYPKLPK